MQCYKKNAKTHFNEDRKLQNDINILMQLTKENRYVNAHVNT